MKLLIATDAWQPQVNGVVRTMGIVIDTMRARGHDVHVISPQDFRSMPCPGYPEIPLAFARPRRLARMIEDYAPDAIHIVTEGPIGFAARRACLRNGWHFTSAFHTRFPEYLRARAPIPVPLTHALFRRFHAASSNVLVPTQSILDDLKARGYGHLKLWTRGVNRTLFHPGRRGESGLPGPVFAYVGRLATEKNIAAFLELALPGTKLVVGDGPQRGELEKRFPDAVFVGAKTGEPLAEAFASADVFVFPSRTDTFGLVILEALASGLPVAAYPVPGPLDILAKAGPSAGVLDEDLAKAALGALELGPVDPDAVLGDFTWDACADIFEAALVPRTPDHAPAFALDRADLQPAV
ncbi:MAG: glycosyltransferase family 1 protein [Brucellaceae bacterium]|nr:glycosyltransferase family 1 protein [Brucellaceae bacterium]